MTALGDAAMGWVASTTAAWEVGLASGASMTTLAALQSQRLKHLLRSAQCTQFYREALQEMDLDHPVLQQLPTCSKTQLMQHFAGHVTDPQLTLRLLQRFCADRERIAQPLLGRYWVWESSGSTGQPGIFVQDARAMVIYDALETLRRAPARPLARCLDPLYLGERFAFIGAIDGHFASHVSVCRLQAGNPWLARHVRSFSILQPTATLADALNAFAPTIIATYPTAAVMLAQAALGGALHIRPQEVWTGGEHLSHAMRQHIENALGCRVSNSYGASEFLPLAWECTHRRLHVNADWVILEAVDEQYQAVAPGVTSHTTLLTNLVNHVQPLIRFDIGDRITFDPTPCPCGLAMPTLQVQGRCDDALFERDSDNRPIMLLPLALTTVLEDQAGVFNFQLQQLQPGRWCLTLTDDALITSTTRHRCRDVLIDFARQQGVVELQVEIRAASARPTHRSGKFRRVMAWNADQE